MPRKRAVARRWTGWTVFIPTTSVSMRKAFPRLVIVVVSLGRNHRRERPRDALPRDVRATVARPLQPNGDVVCLERVRHSALGVEGVDDTRDVSCSGSTPCASGSLPLAVCRFSFSQTIRCQNGSFDKKSNEPFHGRKSFN